MRTFVVPDIHGRYESLRTLFEAADIVDSYGMRTDRSFRVVSIGDLANAVLTDVNGDLDCLHMVHNWFDWLIVGNHEAGYLFDNMSFNGYYPSHELKTLYNSLYRQGIVVPAVLVGETLLTHAGVHEYLNFRTANDAFVGIFDVWDNYQTYRDDYNEKFYFERNIQIPKALLLDAVSSKRGGNSPLGGILWSDWNENKNQSFSQVMGHTPLLNGPVVTNYKGSGVFHANIDCGAKNGLTPWGVWLDEYGQIEEFVTPRESLEPS